jgi:hypothetical protein
VAAPLSFLRKNYFHQGQFLNKRRGFYAADKFYGSGSYRSGQAAERDELLGGDVHDDVFLEKSGFH